MLLYHLLLNIVRKISKLEKNVGNVYDTVYPIGSVYLTLDSTDLSSRDNTLFPGTRWTRIAEGRTLFGAGSTGQIPYAYYAGTEVNQMLPNIKGLAGRSLSDYNRDNKDYEKNELGPGLGNTNEKGPFRLADWTWDYPFSWSPIAGTDKEFSTGSLDAFRTHYFDASRVTSTYQDTWDLVQPNAYVVYMWRRVE